MSIKEEIKSLKEAWDELSENIHSQIDKVYPKNSEENKKLHRAADETQERTKQADMERDLGKHEFKPVKDLFSIDFDPEDEKRIEKETEWETKRDFKPMSKDEIGKRNNLINQFGTSDKEGIESARVARRAIGKRKAKKANVKESFQSQIDSLIESYTALLESVEDQVTKKYGKMFNKNLSPRGLSKHKKVMSNQVDELISAAKRNLPDEEKNLTSAIDREVNKIEARRANTKNKVGAYKTDLHTIGYGGKLRSPVELIDNREKDEQEGFPKATAKSVRRHKEKLDAHESFQSQIDSLIESYTALLEAGVETESTGEEKEVSPNKIRKTKKDKNGNKVEVLSVEDELFPNEGNAKQQYNQKIINKINDMIEGTATLQDLLNLVRQKKVAPVKESYESMTTAELIEELKIKLAYKQAIAEVLDSIMEISQITADKVSSIRWEDASNAKKKYQKYRDGKDYEDYRIKGNKLYKNSELRDKWDILKGLKRGKDGKMHSVNDYKEYKDNNDSK